MPWREESFPDGGTQWKLTGPLRRGQFRPVVVQLADGEVYATNRLGYTRRFTTVEAARLWPEQSPA